MKTRTSSKRLDTLAGLIDQGELISMQKSVGKGRLESENSSPMGDDKLSGRGLRGVYRIPKLEKAACSFDVPEGWKLRPFNLSFLAAYLKPSRETLS